MSKRSLPIALIAVITLACSGTAIESRPEPAPEPVGGEAESGQDAPAENNEAYRNTIKWTTASELDNFGYDVYRGPSEEGPFERITEEPIPGAGTTDEPTDYRFVDDTIDPYETYWYYVESISMASVRERFTPVFPSKPKLQRDPSEPESPAAETGNPDGL
ncbi:MAG: hypothetical protein GY719_08300 [bacterium]|nr:hypothetical protein [bacterium]